MNKNATITLGTLRKLLADSRLSDDMPVAVYNGLVAHAKGIQAVEVHTMKDGAKAIAFCQGGVVCEVKDIEGAIEVFG
jgi:uncharacterized membrane protein YqgA involved in biofilm formation